MKVQRGRRRRRGAALVFVAVAGVTTAIAGSALADPAVGPGPREAELRCHRDEDVACTLVRETSAGVWIWTERFRAAELSTVAWTLAVGAGPISPLPMVSFLAAPSVRATPNGAPILE
jgi:hypothetical protein